MIVVKVGGSLFDHPALGPALRAFLESLAPAEVLLVPGGGPVADAVRALDRLHGLGEEAAHWLALLSLGVTAGLLERIVGTDPLARRTPPARAVGAPATAPTTPTTPAALAGGVHLGAAPAALAGGVHLGLLDPFTFAREDESRPGALPHSWSVTTDSIAARAALVFRAERLVLLKSVDVPPGTPWDRAAANGWVDVHFPQIAAALPCPVEVLNFRHTLEAKPDTRA